MTGEVTTNLTFRPASQEPDRLEDGSRVRAALFLAQEGYRSGYAVFEDDGTFYAFTEWPGFDPYTDVIAWALLPDLDLMQERFAPEEKAR